MDNVEDEEWKKWRRTGCLLALLAFCLGTLTFSPTRQAYGAGVSPTAQSVYGQNGNFTTNTANNGGITSSSLYNPRRIVLDSSGGMYVSDYNNNRVLYFASGSTTASRVYGQGGSYTTNTANKGGISSTSLNQPKSVALDSSGNLYVADTGNNRVLYFASGSTTASRVYGQGGSYTTNTVNAPVGVVSATSLNQPGGVTVDSSGNLYVADTSNNRVLYFASGSTTATRVYGQLLSLITNTVNAPLGTPSSSNFNQPIGVTLDSNGNLYVADLGNNRVLYFASGSTTASRVYGQGGSYTTNTVNKGGLSANSLSTPYTVNVDSLGNVYVVDTANNRVLYFSGTSTTATRVYGQNGSFTSGTANNGGINAQGLNAPVGVFVDSTSNIYIADNSNNRVLKFQTGLSVTTQPPTSVNINTPFTIVVSLVDRGSGAIFPDFTGLVAVAMQAGSGTAGAILSGITTAYAVSGSATFSNLSIDTPGTGYVLIATSSGVGSTTTNTFILTGPLLYTPLTSPSFSFTITGATGTVSAQRTFRVSDTTLSGVGWHMTITSTQFISADGNTLPLTATSITSVSSACTTVGSCVLPTNTVTDYPVAVPAGTTQPTEVTYFNAAEGTGTGDVTITTTFSLTVPPGTPAGTYTSTLTETLVKGQSESIPVLFR